MKATVAIIATKKYKVFAQPLIDSICKYFLLRHVVEIQLFSDEIETEYKGDNRVSIVKELIPSYGYPEATLLRFHIMTSKTYSCDYFYYFDVDYLLVSEIDENIFGEGLVAILHPGFSFAGGGSWCTDKKSNSYTFPEFRQQYFCGGTQGGAYEHYYKAMQIMKLMIQDDEERGTRAEHNDEGAWNKILSEHKSFKILDSSYCYVEQPSLQKLWKIDHLTPKILALAKDHNQIRS